MVLCRGGLVSGRDVDESFTGLDLNSGLASLLRDSKCGIINVITHLVVCEIKGIILLKNYAGQLHFRQCKTLALCLLAHVRLS